MKNNIPKNKYKLETFNDVPKEIFKWLKDSKSKSLILKGASNIGETNFALALFKNFDPIIVGDIEK